MHGEDYRCIRFDLIGAILTDVFGVNTVPTLHVAERLEVVFTGIMQVVAPLAHEQARATSAGSRRELLTREQGLISLGVTAALSDDRTLKELLKNPHQCLCST